MKSILPLKWLFKTWIPIGKNDVMEVSTAITCVQCSYFVHERMPIQSPSAEFLLQARRKNSMSLY